MIEFNFETDFSLESKEKHQLWIETIIAEYGFRVGDITYIFCDDEYLQQINQQYLNHDDLTDIISFDYTEEKEINGDIFISVERVRDNSVTFSTSFEDELRRVMAHGILHFIGFKDKKVEDVKKMRENEEICLSKYINN
jgi:rRNA maturation RNase YbeY